LLPFYFDLRRSHLYYLDGAYIAECVEKQGKVIQSLLGEEMEWKKKQKVEHLKSLQRDWGVGP
jgi:hypothetical protein